MLSCGVLKNNLKTKKFTIKFPPTLLSPMQTSPPEYSFANQAKQLSKLPSLDTSNTLFLKSEPRFKKNLIFKTWKFKSRELLTAFTKYSFCHHRKKNISCSNQFMNIHQFLYTFLFSHFGGSKLWLTSSVFKFSVCKLQLSICWISKNYLSGFTINNKNSTCFQTVLVRWQ